MIGRYRDRRHGFASLRRNAIDAAKILQNS
jgi:hypothetical protein